ncbi:MAG: hypothetical protein IT326_04870 [Anaerolineae bacterium]|nr:hypothetical protein [Anaerolineae bacterium]
MSQDIYDKLEIPALTTILLNPDSPTEAHRGALSALSRREQLHRTSSLIKILESITRHPGRYDLDVMMSVVELLATDPNADATVAMIEVLPSIVKGVLTPTPLREEFREYYYAALLTRERDDDLEVWAEMLPQVEGSTLTAMVLDPRAAPLVEAIDPVTLVDRLGEPDRSRSLVSMVVGLTTLKGSQETLQQVVRLLRQSADPAQLARGIEIWVQRMDQAKRSGDSSAAGIYLKILGLLDRTPRSATEKLTGRRPWAPG